MSALSFSLILAGVVLNAFAQLLLKAGTNAVGHFSFDADNILPIAAKIALEPYIAAGVACYGISLLIWIAALTRTPVSIAYPMLSIGYIIAAFVSWQCMGEDLAPQKLAGIACIVAGVILVARSAGSAN
jgi:drug/metabolite transporter (DMT)-like permease